MRANNASIVDFAITDHEEEIPEEETSAEGAETAEGAEGVTSEEGAEGVVPEDGQAGEAAAEEEK